MTCITRGDSVVLIRWLVLVPASRLGTTRMTLNVNRNLSLETGFAPGVSLETDARTELAAQFILGGPCSISATR